MLHWSNRKESQGKGANRVINFKNSIQPEILQFLFLLEKNSSLDKFSYCIEISTKVLKFNSYFVEFRALHTKKTI